MEFRLDKEGKEFHHFEEFAKMYRAEVYLLYLAKTVHYTLLGPGEEPDPHPGAAAEARGHYRGAAARAARQPHEGEPQRAEVR